MALSNWRLLTVYQAYKRGLTCTDLFGAPGQSRLPVDGMVNRRGSNPYQPLREDTVMAHARRRRKPAPVEVVTERKAEAARTALEARA